MAIDTTRLKETIKKICTPGKGILAADESTGTIKKRFDSIGLESTEGNRRTYRNMLFTSDGIEQYISGVIMFDETVDQRDDSGRTFSELLASKGIVPGVKSDQGKEEHPDFAPQTLTHGLDGLPQRLADWTERSNGTQGFTKWRQVILVEPNPEDAFLEIALSAMARNAADSQAAGFVPITEPEVLMDGGHTIEQCAEVTERTLKILYKQLEKHGVAIDVTLLKPNMVVSGKELKRDMPAAVAQATLEVFRAAVPKEVPGIVFLSGGQSPVQATENLNAINALARESGDPWFLSFSYGRALQEDALKAWGGKEGNVAVAQEAFLKRARLNGLAQKGMYEGE